MFPNLKIVPVILKAVTKYAKMSDFQKYSLNVFILLNFLLSFCGFIMVCDSFFTLLLLDF